MYHVKRRQSILFRRHLTSTEATPTYMHVKLNSEILGLGALRLIVILATDSLMD